RSHRQSAAVADGHATTVAEHVAAIRGDGPESARGLYHLDGNTKLPREVDNRLEMFGCVACNFCITVCPNDAFFSIPTPDGVLPEGTTGRQQYLLFAELCNECGNCMTFCPEDGDPAKIKPRLFTTPEVFEGRTGQGFLLGPEATIKARAGDEDLGRMVGDLLGTEAGNPLGPLGPTTG
ncbi:MAG: 4Fe-4S dicluster domain-containing protein, partial [Actinomycetota bacterium]